MFVCVSFPSVVSSSQSQIISYPYAKVQEKNRDSLPLTFYFYVQKEENLFPLKCRLITDLKILCREHKWDMHSAVARNSLLIPLSFPQGSFSPLNGCGALVGGWPDVLCVQFVPLLCCAASLPPSSPPQTQPGHSPCNSVTWILCFFFFFGLEYFEYLVTWTLPFSRESPLLSSPLSPPPPQVPAGQRQPVMATMQKGTEPQRGEVALQILKVNTASVQHDSTTFPPGQWAGLMLFVHRCIGYIGSAKQDRGAVCHTPSWLQGPFSTSWQSCDRVSQSQLHPFHSNR